ncbi:MAG TPA: hypothetical protein VHE55_01310 [Fimbriimonadaceae bacterium]|nr:hypothetical protein [Fimbriimonadaceae bacterium]
MKRFLPILLLLGCVVCAFGQKVANVVGTWVPDAKSVAADPHSKGMSVTFVKGGKINFKGFNTVGEGTYTISGTKLTVLLSKRNGVKPTDPREKSTVVTIAEGGKALILDMGYSRQGQAVTVRLIRKK